MWYYSLRNLAAVILLGILIYVGIRMAISTVASDEAKYKKMFKDWVVSFIMLFLMHYLMVITIEVNKLLVTILYNSMQNKGSGQWDSYMTILTGDVFHWSFTVGTGALIIYIIMIGVTLLYLVTYIKRMLTIAFLIIISPLITITYSIDKMRDNRSQALDTWMKEFMYNVLIQPFHCIIYLVFIQTALQLMSDSRSMASSVLAVIMILFMHKAEDIVKQIFNFQSASLGKAVANTALITTGLSMLQKRGNEDAKKAPQTDKIPDMSSSKGNASRNQSKNAEQNMNAINQQNQNQQNNNQQNNMPPENSPQPSEDGPNNGQPNNQSGGDMQGGDMQGEGGSDKKTFREKFNDWGNGAIDAAKRSVTPGNIAKGIGTAGLYMILGGLALSTGQPSTIISAYQAGKAVTGGIQGRQNRRRANQLVEKNEKNFAGVYQDFKRKTGKSNEEINMLTNDILNGNIKNSEMDENEQLYASYVRKMGKTYSVTGENDVAGRMEETLSMINNNEINPYTNENYDMFSVPQQGQSPQTEETPQPLQPEETPQPLQPEETPPIIANATEEDFRNAREQANARHQEQRNRTRSSGRKTQGTNSNANGGDQSTKPKLTISGNWSDVQELRDNPNNNKK